MTVLFSGVGLIAAGFAVIVVRQIAGGIVVDQLVKTESAKPAGEAAWSIGTSLMVSIAITVIIVGVLFAAAGWLASPTSPARATRRVIAPALERYVAWVYTGLAIVVSIYFLSASSQGLRSFLTTLVLAGMAAFGIHELRKQAGEEFPDAKFSDTFGSTRDRVVTAVKGANLGERASKLRLPEVRRPAAPGRGRGRDRGGADRADPDDPARRRGRPPAAPRAARRLHEKGILTDEEFAAEKARILAGE